ncbi:hypothetical protein DCC79_10880 [bacterium]|nr:MAG: hypothetical protein DCC79_10880 [bacterium]
MRRSRLQGPTPRRHAVVTLILLAAAACRGAEPAPAGEGSPASAPAPAGQIEASPGAAQAWPASKVPGDTVVAAIALDPASLDPFWTYEIGGLSIDRMLYDRLVDFEREKPDAFVPALATEWSTAADGLSLTFTIRDGVTFHAGGTLEPHDVAYTYRRGLLQDRSGGPMWLYLKPILGVTSITELAASHAGPTPAAGGDPPALGDLPAAARQAACQAVQAAVTADDAAGTVTIRLAAPTPWFLQLVAMPYASIVDQEWMVEQGDWDGTCTDWTRWHDPAAEETVLFDRANGTGPYTLAGWKKNESITLEGWDGYWRTEPAWEGGPSGPPRIEHVVVQNIEEWGTRFAKLQSGEVDHVYVPLPEIDQVEPLVHAEHAGGDASAPRTVVRDDGILTLFKGYPTATANAITFNFAIGTTGGNDFIGSGRLDGDGIPPDFFGDLDVRRAFVQCFDIDAFIRDVMRGDAVQMRGPIIAGLQGYRDDSPIIAFDIDACGASLAKAWGGKLPATGFRLVAPYAEGWTEAEAALDILADGLSRANPGYKLEKVQMPWPTLLDNINNRRLPLAMTGWFEDYHDASNWAYTYLHSVGANSGSQGFPPELAARLDTLVDQAATELDPARRDALYAELQQAAIDNATAIFMNQALGRSYWRREVEGWYIHPLTPGTDFYSLSKPAP